jgi:hypothetical protein
MQTNNVVVNMSENGFISTVSRNKFVWVKGHMGLYNAVLERIEVG